ncbi:hypothetical protein OXX59_003047 [Metschnikowia pulcherrima]
MNDTDQPDPLLQQVPLIRNPAFQPPRPITLNADYGKLLSTLPMSVVPPKAAISRDELDAWKRDLEKVEKDGLNPEKREEEIKVYKDWLSGVQRKVAPGFSFDVMTPRKTGKSDCNEV